MAGRYVKIKDDRREWNRLERRLKTMPRQHVISGITHDATGEEGASVAEYATYNELGLGVPARPFMSRFYDQDFERIVRFSQNALKKSVMGTVTMDAALNAIGLYMQKGIKQSIRTAYQWAQPNSPLTLERKYIKGAWQHDAGPKAAPMFGPQRPKELIDHGIMLNSVTFEIRPGAIRA